VQQLPDSERYATRMAGLPMLSERLAGEGFTSPCWASSTAVKAVFSSVLLGLPSLPFPVSYCRLPLFPPLSCMGARTTCGIEFAGKHPPIRIADSLKDIADALPAVCGGGSQSVQQVWSFAVINLRQPMLQHGTTLIDTPGFGSTHTHNTETARALVEGCDAALFLLSADLPITQAEVDFLKTVQQYVPRIFFLYNKTDLLSCEELQTTMAYIRDVLHRFLHLPAEPVLFPLSVRSAMQAGKREAGDLHGETSGIERIPNRNHRFSSA